MDVSNAMPAVNLDALTENADNHHPQFTDAVVAYDYSPIYQAGVSIMPTAAYMVFVGLGIWIIALLVTRVRT